MRYPNLFGCYKIILYQFCQYTFNGMYNQKCITAKFM